MSQSSSPDLSAQLEVVDLGNGRLINLASLKNMLPDIETALFFGKVYKLDYIKLNSLLSKLFRSTVLDALNEGGHSVDLQDYLVDTIPPDVYPEQAPAFIEAPPKAEILPELWAAAEIVVADSIQKVADKLAGTLALMPGKEGRMVFQHMAKLNRQRPTVGVYGAAIAHARQAQNLVILDDSGSVNSNTVGRIINDVIALSWKANAHLVLVSNTARHWEPGSYNVKDVLRAAQYGGTHYETLTPLLRQDWGTVVTIADYDSSRSAKEHIGRNATGRIGQVLDISLVNRPSFLAECVGQLADEVKPLLISNSHRPLYM